MWLFLANLVVIKSDTVQIVKVWFVYKGNNVNMSVTGSYSLMFAFTRACFDSSFLFDSLESVC